MKITNEYIESLKPCEDRKANYLEHYKGASHSIVEFLSLDKISYEDKLWVWRQFTTKEVALEFAILCAESVLHLFEDRHPYDDRPRKAIEAVRFLIAKPTSKNKQNAISVAHAVAHAVAYAVAYADAAAYDAAKAAYNTADATADAADAAAYAAAAVAYATAVADGAADADAADAAAAAAAAAVDAATVDAAATAARQAQEEKNLRMLIQIYERSSI